MVKVDLPEVPSITTNSTLSIPAGNNAYCYIDDMLLMVAGGGGGRVNNNIAPNGVTAVSVETANTYTPISVHWHSGNGLSGATHSNQFPVLYTKTNPGGCYRGGHIHGLTADCPYRKYDEECHCKFKPGADGNPDRPSGCDVHRHTNKCEGVNCDGNNVWSVTRQTFASRTPSTGYWTAESTTVAGCGYAQGEIRPITNTYAPRPSSGYDSKVDNANAGAAKFEIRLCEQQSVLYKNITAKLPLYDRSTVELMLLDDVVCYYKRR